MSDEAFKQLTEVFRDSFMKPIVGTGTLFEEEIAHTGLEFEPLNFYCKLVADGFMDQTDLEGPFKTLDEAAKCLIEGYNS